MTENQELKKRPAGLDSIFASENVAVIGASDVKDSVGYRLMRNFLDSGFTGKVFPVNMKKSEILVSRQSSSVG